MPQPLDISKKIKVGLVTAALLATGGELATVDVIIDTELGEIRFMTETGYNYFRADQLAKSDFPTEREADILNGIDQEERKNPNKVTLDKISRKLSGAKIARGMELAGIPKAGENYTEEEYKPYRNIKLADHTPIPFNELNRYYELIAIYNYESLAVGGFIKNPDELNAGVRGFYEDNIKILNP